MWAQLITMRLKPEREADLPKVYEHLRAAEQPGSGLLRTIAMRDTADPNQIYNWKKQLLDGAASVFEGGGSAAEGTSNEAQVDVLYRQIGQLKVENDFLAQKLGN